MVKYVPGHQPHGPHIEFNLIKIHVSFYCLLFYYYFLNHKQFFWLSDLRSNTFKMIKFTTIFISSITIKALKRQMVNKLFLLLIVWSINYIMKLPD